MRIILIRHGRTESDGEQVFRGRADVQLDETGLAQAHAAARALAAVDLTAVYSSPLARAYQTACAIAQPHGLRVQAVHGLSDVDCGAWEGLTIDEARSRYPREFEAWQKAPHTFRFPNGESLDEVTNRAAAALRAISASHAEGDNVAIVSHRAVNKLLIMWMIGLDSSVFWRIHQDACCLNVITHGREGYVLNTLNDGCHLTDNSHPEPAGGSQP